MMSSGFCYIEEKNENQFKVVICFLKQKSNWAKFFLEMLVSLHKLADKTYNEKYRSNDILQYNLSFT